MDLHPLGDGGGFDTEDLGYVLLISSRVDSFDGQDFGFEGNRRTAVEPHIQEAILAGSCSLGAHSLRRLAGALDWNVPKKWGSRLPSP